MNFIIYEIQLVYIGSLTVYIFVLIRCSAETCNFFVHVFFKE